MGSFVWLATLASTTTSVLAEAGAEEGFGFNFDIIEANLINLSIVIAILVYFGRQIVPNIMSERKAAIATAIQEVEQRANAAEASLKEQQTKLAQAKAEAATILASGADAAKAAREAILTQAADDVQRLKESATQDLNAARDRAINELRQKAVAMAMQQAEAQLKNQMNESTQHQLIERSIALLGGAK
jgi:F-type H+-transporting ATPase subunit b